MSERVLSALAPSQHVLASVAYLLSQPAKKPLLSAPASSSSCSSAFHVLHDGVMDLLTALGLFVQAGPWIRLHLAPEAAAVKQAIGGQCRQLGLAVALAAALERPAFWTWQGGLPQEARHQQVPGVDNPLQVAPEHVALEKKMAARGTLAVIKQVSSVAFAGDSTAAAGSNAAQPRRLPPPCHHCGKAPAEGQPSFQLCGGCRAVRFCGKECARAAWKAGHKQECRAAAGGGGGAAAAGAGGGGGCA